MNDIKHSAFDTVISWIIILFTCLVLAWIMTGCGILDSTLPEEPEPPTTQPCENLITYFPPSSDGTNTICLDDTTYPPKHPEISH